MINVNKNVGQIILRITLSLVFLYFSLNQLIDPSYWLGFVPNYALHFGLTAKMLVIGNGIFELIFGLMLLSGTYTRIAALLLSLHLIGIASTIGFGDPTGIRDLGLALATLSIVFFGKDNWCLDNKF